MAPAKLNAETVQRTTGRPKVTRTLTYLWCRCALKCTKLSGVLAEYCQKHSALCSPFLARPTLFA